MKRLLLYSLLLATTFTGCRKDETVFDESPDARMTAYLENAESVLTGAEHGWLATIETMDGILFNYYMDFEEGNRVQMMSDFDTTTAGQLKESGYRLKALQQPALLFDTYSYVHLPADPDGNVNGGEPGQGLKADFEFSLDTVKADYVRLTGRLNRNKAILVPATKEQADSWKNRKWLENIASLMSLRKIPTYFTRLWVNGQNVCDVKVDSYRRLINFITYTSTGRLNDNLANFNYVDGGIQLDSPVVVNNITIGSLQNMYFDPATGIVSLRVNEKNAEIGPATAPVVVDGGAFNRWRDQARSNGTLWYAPYGFIREWRSDAFDIYGTLRFYVFGYIPGQTVSTDRLITAYLNEQQDDVQGIYGYFVSPAIKADGRTEFTDMTAYRQSNALNPVTAGTAPDANSEAVMQASTAQLTDMGGYYFIQTGPRSYDMVHAGDARTWVTWALY